MACQLPIHPLADVLRGMVVQVVDLITARFIGKLLNKSSVVLTAAHQNCLAKLAGFPLPIGREFDIRNIPNFRIATLVGDRPKQF